MKTHNSLIPLVAALALFSCSSIPEEADLWRGEEISSYSVIDRDYFEIARGSDAVGMRSHGTHYRTITEIVVKLGDEKFSLPKSMQVGYATQSSALFADAEEIKWVVWSGDASKSRTVVFHVFRATKEVQRHDFDPWNRKPVFSRRGKLVERPESSRAD